MDHLRKSLFLRNLFKFEPWRFQTDNEAHNKTFALLRDFDQFVAKAQADGNTTIPDLVQEMREAKISDVIEENANSFGKALNLLDELRKGSFNFSSHRGGDPHNVLHEGISRKGKEGWREIKELDAPQSYSFKRIYIPSLRGMRVPPSDKSFYLNRTISDYFSGKVGRFAPEKESASARVSELRIFTGLELYDIVRSHLLGSLAERQNVSDFQQFLGQRFFDGLPIALIPREGDDVLHVKIGQEKERPIYELGDGIQSVIILTLPLFVHRDSNLLLFIEEPELFLHPGLQRKLIDAIMDDGDELTRQVFVATHSNQFLDMTLEESRVSVYKFRKCFDVETDSEEQIPRFRIENSSNEDFSLLAELGVRNSSLFLANCTIWVEGVTDRLYVRRILEIVQQDKQWRVEEDIHFAFVEYQGGNITHWSFLECEEGEKNIDVKRVCGRLFLITDHDSGKEERHRQLAESLGDRYYCLPCREIENLLAPDVIKAVIRSYEGEDVELNEFGREDYVNEYLGECIENSVLQSESKRPVRTGRPYANTSGTIKDKRSFAERALVYMNSESDLSREALELGGRIYDFISAANNGANASV